MDEPVVLVVDDSPTVRKIVQLTLQREQIRVVTAGDGLSALAAVADEQPDLILLDIMLPRMDGYNICQVVRKNMAYRDMPIIMLSGKDGLFDKMRGKFAGSTEYITKPFDSAELVQTVKRHLDSAVVRERAAQRAMQRQQRGMRRRV
ncbi:MAG TPA: response regulator [Ktedonobacterales bacterium]|nr:response regulator [Ktedonobacterales bacterium]